ncbi:Gfo/Idh/MocA family protein [Polyangium aurulentum]|uniref:Gfo/Idh/MocA family protein n=1 Tax=Polyangium aurulentum TaxID=2567896 RepID=UPI0010ADF9AA|nr:Gfo/Idh/MocA family oxidoreductase [Polyangium aurulentum]UQA60952.1 Gfo/Idh/MocA family oxidoreductase [Polyangium aurulentum]
MSVRVALIGCGAWGQNLLRTLGESPIAQLVAVADASPARRDFARAHAPASARIVATLEEAIEAGARAVVIATPSTTHANVALAAIEAGMDVLVEKPLALTAAEADVCAARAAATGRVGMVGHLLRYHPAVRRLLALVEEGHLGEVRHLGAARLSIRGDRTVSALWSLGPHDLSVLHALDPRGFSTIEAVTAAGGDPVVLHARTDKGITARIELSRAHPTKERRIVVVGTARTAVLDDVRAPDRIVVARSEGGQLEEEIRVAWREPLAVEIEHFLSCVEDRARPLTPFEEGAAVVRALAEAEVFREVGSRAATLPLDAGEAR